MNDTPKPAPKWLRDVLAKDLGRQDSAEVQRERSRRQETIRRRMRATVPVQAEMFNDGETP